VVCENRRLPQHFSASDLLLVCGFRETYRLYQAVLNRIGARFVPYPWALWLGGFTVFGRMKVGLAAIGAEEILRLNDV